MSSLQLPLHIDPIRMADVGSTFVGTMPLKTLDRLENVISNQQDEITVQLEFGKDIEGIRFVHGLISGQVELVCQRCLKPFMLAIKSEFALSPVKDDQEAKELSTLYEPLLMTNEILLKTIIEDELLLNLPLVPMHPVEECSVKLAESEPEVVKKTNPFSQLANLKIKQQKD